MNSDCGFYLGNGFVSQALPLPQNHFVYSLQAGGFLLFLFLWQKNGKALILLRA